MRKDHKGQRPPHGPGRNAGADRDKSRGGQVRGDKASGSKARFGKSGSDKPRSGTFGGGKGSWDKGGDERRGSGPGRPGRDKRGPEGRADGPAGGHTRAAYGGKKPYGTFKAQSFKGSVTRPSGGKPGAKRPHGRREDDERSSAGQGQGYKKERPYNPVRPFKAPFKAAGAGAPHDSRGRSGGNGGGKAGRTRRPPGRDDGVLRDDPLRRQQRKPFTGGKDGADKGQRTNSGKRGPSDHGRPFGGTSGGGKSGGGKPFGAGNQKRFGHEGRSGGGHPGGPGGERQERREGPELRERPERRQGGAARDRRLTGQGGGQGGAANRGSGDSPARGKPQRGWTPGSHSSDRHGSGSQGSGSQGSGSQGSGDRDGPRSPSASAGAPNEPMRIAKAIARAGLCSRRDAERWIDEGRVSVNGKVLGSPAVEVGPRDRILVDGQPLPEAEGVRLWRYHKPRGLVTTHHDPEGRPTVFDNLPKDLPRVISIGRLDFNTEGLLLLTNDGELARHLELPSTGWLRRYRVRARGRVSQGQLDALKEGVSVEGINYGPVEASLDSEQGANIWLTIGLREGKNREIRKILTSLGLEVSRLIRVSFGPFQLLELEPGEVDRIRRRTLREQLGPRIAREMGLIEGTEPEDEPRERLRKPRHKEAGEKLPDEFKGIPEIDE